MIAPAHVAFRALQGRRRPDCQFSELNTHPTYSPVYASPCTSRCPAQNSGPSGSLGLSRKNFAFSASCRFSPAHCNRLLTTVIKMGCTECRALPGSGTRIIVVLLLDDLP